MKSFISFFDQLDAMEFREIELVKSSALLRVAVNDMLNWQRSGLWLKTALHFTLLINIHTQSQRPPSPLPDIRLRYSVATVVVT
jgi:hypothetical protein